jgi:hypothetical protein
VSLELLSAWMQQTHQRDGEEQRAADRLGAGICQPFGKHESAGDHPEEEREAPKRWNTEHGSDDQRHAEESHPSSRNSTVRLG